MVAETGIRRCRDSAIGARRVSGPGLSVVPCESQDPFVRIKVLKKKMAWITGHSALLAEWTGLEPATPGVTGRYSNQLNYHSIDLQSSSDRLAAKCPAVEPGLACQARLGQESAHYSVFPSPIKSTANAEKRRPELAGIKLRRNVPRRRPRGQGLTLGARRLQFRLNRPSRRFMPTSFTCRAGAST